MKESPAETRQPTEHNGDRSDEPVKPAAKNLPEFLKANAAACAGILAFAASLAVIAFGVFPGIYDKAVTAQTQAVLELSDTEIDRTSLDDLTAMRTYVDVYAKDKDADPAVTDKARRILDTAITERSNGR